MTKSIIDLVVDFDPNLIGLKYKINVLNSGIFSDEEIGWFVDNNRKQELKRKIDDRRPDFLIVEHSLRGLGTEAYFKQNDKIYQSNSPIVEDAYDLDYSLRKSDYVIKKNSERIEIKSTKKMNDYYNINNPYVLKSIYKSIPYTDYFSIMNVGTKFSYENEYDKVGLKEALICVEAKMFIPSKIMSSLIVKSNFNSGYYIDGRNSRYRIDVNIEEKVE